MGAGTAGLDAAAVGRIDTRGMARAYSAWPEMARRAYGSASPLPRGPLPHHVVFAGMGGSGAISDLFESVLSGDDIHVDVVKGYHLPRTAGPDTLVVAVGESISVLGEIAPSVSDVSLGGENPALSLAAWLPEVPLVYYPWGLRAAAIRFKNSLQENAKTHAMAEDVMEACHNGIVAWGRDSRVRPVLVRGGDDHERTKERWGILEGFFRSRGISHRTVEAPGSSILARLVGLMYTLDYASIYRAVMLCVDPTPVEPIEYVKGRLAGVVGRVAEDLCELQRDGRRHAPCPYARLSHGARVEARGPLAPRRGPLYGVELCVALQVVRHAAVDAGRRAVYDGHAHGGLQGPSRVWADRAVDRDARRREPARQAPHVARKGGRERYADVQDRAVHAVGTVRAPHAARVNVIAHRGRAAAQQARHGTANLAEAGDDVVLRARAAGPAR